MENTYKEKQNHCAIQAQLDQIIKYRKYEKTKSQSTGNEFS